MLLAQVREFKYIGVLFKNDRKVEYEMDRCFGAASSVLWVLCMTFEVKRELSWKATLLIYHLI